MPSPRTPKTLLAAGALALACAAPAAADSVAYVKGGDLYLTTTDGARQFQVTQGGQYSTVSQADDGSLLAADSYGDLVHLTNQGEVLSSTPSLNGHNAGSWVFFDGPWDADISPNGAKTAYGFFYNGVIKAPGESPSSDSDNATAVTRTEQETSVTEAGYKWLRSWDAPEWIDDDTLLVSNGPGLPSDPLAVSTAGSGDEKGWFTDPNNLHPMDGTLSRNKRVIADIGGPERLSLHIYRDDDGVLLGGVHACMTYSDAAGAGYTYSSPTLNASGSRVWWATGKGLATAPIGDATTTCPDPQNGDEILPGAFSPDWGPADVPTSRTVPFPGSGPAPTPTATATTAPVKTPTPVKTVSPDPTPTGGDDLPPFTHALTVTVAKGKLAKVAAHGLKLTVNAPAAGPVLAKARYGGKTAGQGSASAKAAGPVSVKVTFTKAAKKKLKKAHKATLSISVAAGTATKAVSVTLKR